MHHLIYFRIIRGYTPFISVSITVSCPDVLYKKHNITYKFHLNSEMIQWKTLKLFTQHGVKTKIMSID